MNLGKKDIIELYETTKLNLFPAIGKQPIANWKYYQKHKISLEELKLLLNKEWNNIGIILGGQDGVECIDIDNPDKNDTPEKILKKLLPLIKELKIYVEKTPSNGYHLIYRRNIAAHNTVLARNSENKTLIEIRGQGGFVVISPTPQYVCIYNSLLSLPLLEDYKYITLLSVCKDFDASDKAKNYINFIPKRIGDVYNSSDDWKNILQKHDWKLVGNNSTYEYWKRPGTSNYCSATFNKKLRRFYCFSTNAQPFEANASYYPFAIYTLLEHKGDFVKAAQKLSNIITIPEKHNSNSANNFAHLENSTIVQPSTKNKINDWIIAKNFLKEKGEFRYNTVKNRIEFKSPNKKEWELLSNKLIEDWYSEFRELDYRMGWDNFQHILQGSLSTPFNPFEDYFNNLPEWDNNDYIKNFLNCLVLENEEEEQFIHSYFKKWIIGVVAQTLQFGKNDHCFVLVGNQGIGKTSFFEYLVPKQLKDYYAILPSAMDPKSKDSQILVAEKFLINLDEIEGSSKDDMEALKSILTTTKVTIRRPYARITEDLQRHASFCASANHTYFLKDLTGNRRYFIATIKKINFPTYFDTDGLYSQCYHLLKNNFPYWLDIEEVKNLNEINEQHRALTLEEELIIKRFKPVEVPTEIQNRHIVDWCNLHANEGVRLLTTAEIINELIASTYFKNFSVRIVGLILKNLGFKQYRIIENNSKLRKFVVIDTNNLGSFKPVTQNKTDDDDPGF